MNVTIRKAILGDIATLRAINLSSFEANGMFDPFIDMNWVNTSKAEKLFSDSVTKDDHYTVMAEVDGNPVGFLILGPKQYAYRTVRMIELDILAVLPEYRSKGIGSALVANAKQWAKECGYQTMYASSYIKNVRAVEFYKREGFAPIDISLELTL